MTAYRRPGVVAASARLSRWLKSTYGDDTEAQIRTACSDLECDGAHHPGQRCDYWGCCTGMSTGVPERDAAGRHLAGVAA